jgi:Domain of unknown function (DU1801)
MAEPKTKPTKVSVSRFIAAVPNETRRKDAKALLKLFASATGWKPRMWGPTIVGYGVFKYTYESGHSGESCVCGFSPRTANLVIYSGALAKDKRESLLKKLGKHKTKGGCLYINKLADVDEKALAQIIKAGVANMKKAWPVSAS